MSLVYIFATTTLPVSENTLTVHDIKVPEVISNFPLAPGWWLSVLLTLVISLWLFGLMTKKRRLNAARKLALAHLNDSNELNEKDCIALLKWSAMEYFDRNELANIFGQEFKCFLLAQLPLSHQKEFTELISASFDRQYQSPAAAISELNSDCQQATRLWLTHALPPKKSKTGVNHGINAKSLQETSSMTTQQVAMASELANPTNAINTVNQSAETKSVDTIKVNKETTP